MKKIIIALSVPVLLFATDSSNYKQPQKEQSSAEQLQVMKQKRDEIRNKLNAIPGIQKKMIEMQETIKRASTGQRTMAELYLKSRKICEENRAKDELAGKSFKRIQANYDSCKEETGESSVFGMHSQLMKDIGSFQETIKKHIEDSTDLINKKDILENSGAYAEEAILMLEEQLNNSSLNNVVNPKEKNKKNDNEEPYIGN